MSQNGVCPTGGEDLGNIVEERYVMRDRATIIDGALGKNSDKGLTVPERSCIPTIECGGRSIAKSEEQHSYEEDGTFSDEEESVKSHDDYTRRELSGEIVDIDRGDGNNHNTKLVITEEAFTELSSIIKSVLRVFNIPYVDSPMESDSECSYLNKIGLIDGVITEDNDVFLYGCKEVYRNVFKKGKDVVRYRLEDIEKSLNLSRVDLIKLSYLLGSDYTIGIRGYGPVKALEALRDGKVSDEDVGMLKNLYYNPAVKHIKKLEWGTSDSGKIYTFLAENAVDKEKIDELIHLISNINREKCTIECNEDSEELGFFSQTPPADL